MKKTSKNVLVLTAKQGVFFGTLQGEPSQAEVTITTARNCYYWVAQLRGVLGLAETGPVDGCKVGPAVPSLTLYEITAVVECTPEATSQWEAASWAP